MATPSPATLDVVIVTWNPGPIFDECLRSLVARLTEAGLPPGEGSTIVVVDNASDAGLRVPPELAWSVQLIGNRGNRGFAAACNQGAREGSAARILFLNPDVILGAGAVSESLATLPPSGSQGVGVVGIQLRDVDGGIVRSCARCPRLPSFLAALLRLPYLGASGYLMTDWDHARSRPVDHVTGACYFVRRDLFETLGGFDERFFVYFEDLDFSMRVREAGWDIRYLATAFGQHRGGWSTGQGRRTRLYHDWRSRAAFAHKHFGSAGAAAVVMVTAVVDPFVRVASAVRHRSWREVRDVVAVCRSLLRGRAPVGHDDVTGPTR